MNSFLRAVALFAVPFLTLLPHPALAASCIDWPAICSDDDRFLLGTAEIEGRIDATSIGLSANERFSLRFESMGATNGQILSESAFAKLDMDRSGNSVPIYGQHRYDGGTSNAEELPDGPLSDRFGGSTSLLPSLSNPGDIINDYSLASVDLDARAADGVFWPDFSLPTHASAIGQFQLNLGFYALDIDPSDPESYGLDTSRFVSLTATSFDLFRFTYSSGTGAYSSREMAWAPNGEVLAAAPLVPTPLPAPAMLLLAGLGGFAILRRKRLVKG